MKLRDYQEDIVNRSIPILNKYKVLYLAMEVRTGKTISTLTIASRMNFKKTIFITKKKAISSIEEDVVKCNYKNTIDVTNYESLHKYNESYDLIIVDECHSIGAFPKPSKRAKDIKTLFISNPNAYYIMLSGTPSPESYSQMFHQFWVSPNTPFKENSFYKWARNYVNVKQKRVAYGTIVNDYSCADKKKIFEVIAPLTITYTQKQAGFQSKINETILKVDMNKSTYNLANKLVKDLVIDDKIVADSAVKLQSKLHQIYSGTIKFDDGERMIFDKSKGEYIKNKFNGKKIGIFYKFVAELDLLKDVFGDGITTNIDEFNTTDKNIAYQIQSGREGTNLSKAEALVFYNIDFSATSYWQARDRMTTINRKESNVYWVFSNDGIEEKIYKTVLSKKSYTTSHFKRDYNVRI